MKNKLVCLVILDGWGLRLSSTGNAVYQAKTPNFDSWLRDYESSILDASGEAVGLLRGQMGNSEVGHLNIGSGRVVRQSISRIDHAIQTGGLKNHPDFVSALDSIKKSGKNIHLVGLLGPGGVHSHVRHLLALMEICKTQGIVPILHLITDGRDTPPRSGKSFYEPISTWVNAGWAKVATMGGRYYYMDRDNRWERTMQAYNLMIGKGEFEAVDVESAFEKSYGEDITDEFILPTMVDPDLVVQDGDCIIFYNFRADRMRQLVGAFTRDEITEISDRKRVPNLMVLTMTKYDEELPVRVLFLPEEIRNPLASVLSEHGLGQFHIAETEKYAHVTYFFNGGHEEPYPGEEHYLVPSPKVATYDLQPEMSAQAVVDKVIERLQTHEDAFILVNFANPDMVGHSGILEAAIRAVECVDQCAGKVVEAVRKKGGVVLVTADHGNSEMMVDLLTQQPHTYHTTSPVPFIVLSDQPLFVQPRGVLADIAPTILDLFGIDYPSEFDGVSLLSMG